MRLINASSTYDDPPKAYADFDFVLELPEVDLSEAKPSRERAQPHFVGNTTRIPSFTYEGELKPSTMSLSGNLKFGHLINGVFGACASNTSSTGYFHHSITGIGTKKTMFGYFVHGGAATTRIKTLLGGHVDTLDIEGKEQGEITYNANVIFSKMVACATNWDVTSTPSNTKATPYYHFKHAAVNMSIGGTTYTSSTQNQVERFKMAFKNNTTLKHGAPSTGGQDNANWSKEGAFDCELELDLYPEDDLLWRLAPSESLYADNNGASSSRVDVIITLTRNSTTPDSITFTFQDFAVMSVSEKIPAIDQNVSPATVVLRPAQASATMSVLIKDQVNPTTYY